MSLLDIFRKPAPQEYDNVPSEQELNVIRTFALGNYKLRESATKIGRKYITYAIQHPNEMVELQFMREVDNPCPDLVLRAMYREKIQENFCTMR